VGGASNRSVAALYGVSESALRRHKSNHLPAKLAKAQAAEAVVQADGLLEQVRALQGRALAILARAEAAGDLRAALGAIREARSNLELVGEVTKELDRSGTINLELSPEWLELRGVIVAALAPHPAARDSVLRALEGGANGPP